MFVINIPKRLSAIDMVGVSQLKLTLFALKPQLAIQMPGFGPNLSRICRNHDTTVPRCNHINKTNERKEEK